MRHEAILYEKRDDNSVHCLLCAHRCRIFPGKRGICRVRENRDGILYSMVYGKLVAEHVDPIEKKPLYHFLPGSLSYSVATAGCNLSCRHCQNYEISILPSVDTAIPGQYREPDEVVKKALESGCRSISYTYTEPTIFLEYALDCCRQGRDAGLRNVFVTNGFMTPEAVKVLTPCLDAANVDLKGATEDFYRQVCGGHMEPVLETIRALYEAGIWIEVTTLLIPGLNDDQRSLGFISEFIASIDPLIPWHISRFFPTYKMTDHPPTPLGALRRAERDGKSAGLKYTYIGNISHEDDQTLCHRCGNLLLERSGFTLINSNLSQDGACPKCGTAFNGIPGEGS
ncbi:MAG TPA: AmmeMemoRadiSam system radical SAM enzyme [Proteobacteria bacterium]|nr:molybdenum cofactor biosynthesis protein A [bacterium BMS3Abin14]HDL52496.1 AmmeMemoRadiSam system radical SAM enzyme [Pseudomonadota bacterium]